MGRKVGTLAFGVRTPIVKEGDNIVDIVCDSVLDALDSQGMTLKDKDIVGITESLVARAQGNFVKTAHIAKDINDKYENHIGIVFPIFSRNRFSLILKGIVESQKKITLLMNYPSDEVGNHLIHTDEIDAKGINPLNTVLTEEEFRDLFGQEIFHEFTGIDYIRLYKDIGGDNLDIIFSNDPKTILDYTDEVLVANVHDRKRTKEILKDAGARIIYGQEDILTSSIDGSGYNPEYGLLGANLASTDELKLFPRDSQMYVEEIQNKLKERTGSQAEVLVYGDGAFKDPVGKIWELADPVVSPGFTDGLKGLPSEVKIKYIADTELKNVYGEDAVNLVKQKIYKKENDLLDEAESLGTTPRQITDLVGSLCDLVSGSGDKGTPVVLIKGYFDNFATD